MTDSDRGRLLIVDDEPVILELLTSVFETSAYDVVAAASGTEALAEMEAGGVDVLLTDKNLPDIGGIELLRHARRLQPDAEVLIITGYASLDTALDALKLGAFDYIVKPPKSVFDVQRKVEQAFEKQRIVRENRRLVIDLQRKNDELASALEELKEIQAELIQSEKLAGLGTLAAGIAHEVSSPLFGIMGLAEAILDEEDLALVRDYAREIVDYSGSIKEIVVQLSGYSRTARKEYLTTVELRAVVSDAVRLVLRSTSATDEAVVIDIPNGMFVNARTNEIQQVFVNLVKNAIEAGVEAGCEPLVNIRAERSDKYVTVYVSDNGPGIESDAQKAIFDPFYTTKPPGKGTGLGLNIVYRIVTKYRGTITVESDESGTGATFRLRFPVED